MEQQQIQSIQTNAIAQAAALEQQLSTQGQNAQTTAAQLYANLVQQGVSATGLGAQLTGSLVNINQQLNQQTEQAISNLVAALAGNNKNTITIQEAQTG
jgi:hypothetical protein